jgi:hypothetical protein
MAQTKTAGAFDVRYVVAALMGAYGVILTILGLVNTSDAELDKADGFNVNLWAGLGLLAFAVAFGLWARLRPLVVRELTDEEREAAGRPADDR